MPSAAEKAKAKLDAVLNNPGRNDASSKRAAREKTGSQGPMLTRIAIEIILPVS